MVNNVTLTHPSVNGGTAVILYSPRINFAMKKLSKTQPIPGKYDIAEVEYAGIENPKITINFVIDVDEIDSNEMTQELLTEFLMVRSTTPITLSVPTGATPTYLKGRPTNGYETDGDMTLLDTIKVSIDDFTIDLNSSADRAHLWTYKLVLTETI